MDGGASCEKITPVNVRPSDELPIVGCNELICTVDSTCVEHKNWRASCEKIDPVGDQTDNSQVVRCNEMICTADSTCVEDRDGRASCKKD